MNLGELRAELWARGFDYLNDQAQGQARTDRWLNDGHTDLCEADHWPFLQATAAGATPLTVADLREVLSVNLQGGAPLEPVDRRELTGAGIDLTAPGAARWFYLEGLEVRTCPAGATVTVRYLKVPAALTAASDTPIAPSRYHGLIVDAAVIRAYTDDDDYEEARALRAQWEARVKQMADRLIDPILAPWHILRTQPHEGL